MIISGDSPTSRADDTDDADDAYPAGRERTAPAADTSGAQPEPGELSTTTNTAALVAARALYRLLLHPCFIDGINSAPTVKELVPQLLVMRLLAHRVGLGQAVFGIDESERLIYEQGRSTEQADIVGYARRAGAKPQHAADGDDKGWVARVQIEVKIGAPYNAAKVRGSYVGDVQLDRYAKYADDNSDGEPDTACWVLMPDARAGAGPEFSAGYADMVAQQVNKPSRWQIATWGQVRAWLERALGPERVQGDEHTELVAYLAQGSPL